MLWKIGQSFFKLNNTFLKVTGWQLWSIYYEQISEKHDGVILS